MPSGCDTTGGGFKKSTPARFLAVDFFCGAGCTTCGLIGAGGYVIAGIDKDTAVEKTFQSNNRNNRLDRRHSEFLAMDIFPKTEEYPGGQQEELFSKLDELICSAKSNNPSTPLLFAICAPCQPFTTLSRKEMTSDRQSERTRDRGLLLQALQFVGEYGPEYVLSENVAGISDERFGGIWREFEEGLAALGYDTGSAVVDASDFGIAQFRKRSILLAIKRGSTLAIPKTLLVPSAGKRNSRVTVRETLSHFPRIGPGQQHPLIPNHKTRALSELNQRRIASVRPGQPNSHLQTTRFGDLSLPCHNRVNAKLQARCFNDVYTRMHPDRPSPTITTKCHSISNGRFGHFDMKQRRGISLREAAALQSFPDRYVFHPPERVGVIAKMIGNAVPPKLARFFADYLVSGAAVQSAYVEVS